MLSPWPPLQVIALSTGTANDASVKSPHSRLVDAFGDAGSHVSDTTHGGLKHAGHESLSPPIPIQIQPPTPTTENFPDNSKMRRELPPRTRQSRNKVPLQQHSIPIRPDSPPIPIQIQPPTSTTESFPDNSKMRRELPPRIRKLREALRPIRVGSPPIGITVQPPTPTDSNGQLESRARKLRDAQLRPIRVDLPPIDIVVEPPTPTESKGNGRRLVTRHQRPYPIRVDSLPIGITAQPPTTDSHGRLVSRARKLRDAQLRPIRVDSLPIGITVQPPTPTTESKERSPCL
ncbi:hypothetical protein H0H92_000349 [Tricholoma furcatifolium]|nr:hypothetical protein H0H92_000349 [Tricholoma furcatifolium]